MIEGKLVQFGTACLAITILDFFGQKVGIDIFENSVEDPHSIKIVPQMFVVDNFDGRVLEKEIVANAGIYSGLKVYTNQLLHVGEESNDNIFRAMSGEETVTVSEVLAANFCDYFKSISHSREFTYSRTSLKGKRRNIAYKHEQESFPI